MSLLESRLKADYSIQNLHLTGITNLPTTINRIYNGPGDLQLILDLLRKVRLPEYITEYPGVTDLRELLYLPAIQDSTRIWLIDQFQVIAFALVDSYNNLLFEFDADLDDFDLQADIINWGAECIARKIRDPNEKLTLDASCRADDHQRIALLERYGFIMQPIRSLRLARTLNESIPEPSLPAGFSIRSSRGLDEIEEWVLLHQAAFGTQHMTHEERLAMISGPDYEPSMDLVATAPDGHLVAYCLCQINREENLGSSHNEGYTDPVATHPEYQGRGLARALLLSGIRLLKDHGADTAVLGTSSENEKMLHVAQAVGYRIVGERVWFEKLIETTVKTYIN